MVAAVAAMALVASVVLTTSDGRVAASGSQQGVSLFDESTEPKLLHDSDRVPVELGVRVRFAEAGVITAVKFYKGPKNLGPHVGHVWSASGELLAEAAFVDTSRMGWQITKLARPVRVQAGSEYVISYHAPHGAYAADVDYFASRAVTKSPLTAPAGRNGVYRYGPSSGFPTTTWRSSNYYVDLVFHARGGVLTPVPRPGNPTVTLAPSPDPTTITTAPTSPAPTSPAPTSPAPTSPGGFPGPDNTGVPPDRTLTEHRGELRITKSGSVVSDLRVYGSITIEADNVTVQNVEVICSNAWWIIRDNGRGNTIQDSTLTVDRSSSSNYCQYGITGGDEVKILRNDISFTPDGLTFAGDSAEVRANWVHDQIAYPGKDDHVDAAQLNGGGSGPYLFIGNHFSVPEPQTGCLALFADFGPIRNVTVQGNLFDGAGYSFYGGTDSATNVQVTDNVFGTTFFPKGGYYGPVTSFNSGGTGNVWSNNRWLRTGTPVSPG
jgi:hypothetical protein